MTKKLDPRLIEILKEYGEDPNEALWDCHGTWVAYHRAIERIAAKAGIVFEMPTVIEGNSSAKTVAIAVRGHMVTDAKDRTFRREEWSFGEASPANNKNAYPYAMAEKRAKDRVVLKLVGLHGEVYSEEEVDDFKAQRSVEEVITNSMLKDTLSKHEREEHGMINEADYKPTKRVVGVNPKTGERTANDIRNKDEVQLKRELAECHTVLMIQKLAMAWSVKAETEKWPEAWKAWARGLMQDRKEAILNSPPDDDFIPEDPDPRTSPANTILAGG